MVRAGLNGRRIMTDNSNEGAKITNDSKDTRLDTGGELMEKELSRVTGGVRGPSVNIRVPSIPIR
jgi:hypothetical protein